jgi:NAD(P)-dependent dehydrogenase (short-subunit alcohol dehydrogenase family)
VRFTETIAEENRDTAIEINAIAPGALNTRLLDEVLAAGPEKVGVPFYQKALSQKKDGGAPLSAGAKLCAYLLSGQSDGITGKLISAIWDPWESFSSHRDDLNRSDVYTLRRILPKERGFTWGEK